MATQVDTPQSAATIGAPGKPAPGKIAPHPSTWYPRPARGLRPGARMAAPGFGGKPGIGMEAA